jgi:hypothetical protein
LPFNIIGELSRTVALALRLFGNMLSGALIGAIIVYLAGLLLPVPLMMLSVLTSLVQAYIFGVLTLVFAVSSVETVSRGPRGRPRRASDDHERSDTGQASGAHDTTDGEQTPASEEAVLEQTPQTGGAA